MLRGLVLRLAAGGLAALLLLALGLPDPKLLVVGSSPAGMRALVLQRKLRDVFAGLPDPARDGHDGDDHPDPTITQLMTTPVMASVIPAR